MWPCMWSICLAMPRGDDFLFAPGWEMLPLFAAGSVLLRGAGCTVNDLWDRELDKKVARTRGRPIAAGDVTPFNATAFLGAQLLAGLGILLQLPPAAQYMGCASLALVGTYPAMKRVTWWPQAFLGLTINWGALMGWAAATGSVDWAAAVPLYLAGACWTMVYDTIYAHQDKRDDVAAGVKSTALLFGENTRPVLGAFAAGNALLLAVAGGAAGCGPLYFLGAVAAGSHLARQVVQTDLDDAAQCQAAFDSNVTYGGILMAGILADRAAALL
ncbi:unnamed protein product [Pedinophyceae sp. YPF-701]|nr:unnamed protein product [Pedinophyceae sp. YPF-701]